MGAWIRQKKTAGIWGMFGPSHWTFSPYLPGNENPNKPPPEVADKAVDGPIYNAPNGKSYHTWVIPNPQGTGTNEIVDYERPA